MATPVASLVPFISRTIRYGDLASDRYQRKCADNSQPPSDTSPFGSSRTSTTPVIPKKSFGALACRRTGLMSSTTQYLDTTSCSSSAVTALIGPSGTAALSKTRAKYEAPGAAARLIDCW